MIVEKESQMPHRTDVSSMTLRSPRSLGDAALSPSAHPRITRGHAVRGSARPSPKLLPSVATSHVPARYRQV